MQTTEFIELDPGSDQDLTRVAQAVSRVGRKVANGGHIGILITEIESGPTPAQAARMLGVSRQFVDRLISQGALEARRLPGSTHRRVNLESLRRFKVDRDRREAALGRAVRKLNEVDRDLE